MLRVGMGSFGSVGTCLPHFPIIGLIVISSVVSMVACPLDLDKLFQSDLLPSPGRELGHCLRLFLDQRAEEVTEYKSIENGRNGVAFFKLVNLV